MQEKNIFNTFDFAKGEVLLIHKPLGWTSFDVVRKLRYTLRVKKIGHAGTLDPLAEGLLVLCTGKKTKVIESIQAEEKEYIGKLYLGKTTPSYDLETDFDSENSIDHLTDEDVHAQVSNFIGAVQQVPPVFSAIKVGGRRAYKSARKGQEVKIEPRTVFISEFEILNINFPEVEFRVVCSKGTYIRTIASDFGKNLGVGAHLSYLSRTRIGDLKLEDAHILEDFVQACFDSKEEI